AAVSIRDGVDFTLAVGAVSAAGQLLVRRFAGHGAVAQRREPVVADVRFRFEDGAAVCRQRDDKKRNREQCELFHVPPLTLTLREAVAYSREERNLSSRGAGEADGRLGAGASSLRRDRIASAVASQRVSLPALRPGGCRPTSGDQIAPP